MKSFIVLCLAVGCLYFDSKSNERTLSLKDILVIEGQYMIPPESDIDIEENEDFKEAV